MQNAVPVIILIGTLTACGSGGTAPGAAPGLLPGQWVDVTFSTEQSGANFRGGDDSNDATTVQVTLGTPPNNEVFDFVVDATPEVIEPEGFTAFLADGAIMVRGVTTSGGGMGQAYVLAAPAGGLDAVYRQIRRQEPAAFVTTGQTTYEGAYMGVYRAEGSQAPVGHITGLARYRIEFDQSLSSGTITDRQDAGTGVLDDVIFSGTGLADGRFVGGTEGGAFQESGLSALDGEYQGYIVGGSGQEVIGSLRIRHRKDGSPEFTEVGVFTGALAE